MDIEITFSLADSGLQITNLTEEFNLENPQISCTVHDPMLAFCTLHNMSPNRLDIGGFELTVIATSPGNYTTLVQAFVDKGDPVQINNHVTFSVVAKNP